MEDGAGVIKADVCIVGKEARLAKEFFVFFLVHKYQYISHFPCSPVQYLKVVFVDKIRLPFASCFAVVFV